MAYTTEQKQALQALKDNAENAYKLSSFTEGHLQGSKAATITMYFNGAYDLAERAMKLALEGYTLNPSSAHTLFGGSMATIAHFYKPQATQDAELKAIFAELEVSFKADTAKAEAEAKAAEEARILAEATAAVDAELQAERLARIQAETDKRQQQITERVRAAGKK